MSEITPGTKELSTKKSKRVPKHLEHINLLAAGIDIGATSKICSDAAIKVSAIRVDSSKVFFKQLCQKIL